MTRHDLKAALRQLPAPELSPDLLQRILRSRSIGRRVSFPTREVASTWRWIAVAAAVALVIGGSWVVSLSLSKIGESRDQLDELWRGRNLWPSSGVTEGSPRKTAAPAYALIMRDALDTSRLMSGVWTYRSETVTDGVVTQPSGGDRIRMVRATYAGAPAWIVNTARQFREGWSQYEDTTYLDATSLRPLRSASTVNKGRSRFEQTFSGDSGYETFITTGNMKGLWRGAIAFPFPGNALFINWNTERLAALTPALRLHRGWRGSLYQVAFISRMGIKGVTPLDVRVVGTDRITVPAGTFDCWRVEVTNSVWDPWLLRMWVSREKGWLIKEQSRGGDFVNNRMLESYEPGS
jgi:hypothetical protein